MAQKMGGGAMMSTAGSVVVSDGAQVIFADNTATTGGGIFANSAASLLVADGDCEDIKKNVCYVSEISESCQESDETTVSYIVNEFESDELELELPTIFSNSDIHSVELTEVVKDIDSRDSVIQRGITLQGSHFDIFQFHNTPSLLLWGRNQITESNRHSIGFPTMVVVVTLHSIQKY